MSCRYLIHPMEQSFKDWENERRINPPRKLPYFKKGETTGFGVDRDNLGYIVVYGNAEKYALTPQRYDTFEQAEDSIGGDHIDNKIEN